MKKTKKLVFQWAFFILCMRYTFTSTFYWLYKDLARTWRLYYLETPYLKKIRTQCLPILGQKQQKVTISEVLALVSQSLSHILGNDITPFFLRDWKLKVYLRNFIFWPFGGQNVGLCWVKNGKKAIFIPATSIPT